MISTAEQMQATGNAISKSGCNLIVVALIIGVIILIAIIL
jgi:hypothetical protein